MRTFKFYKEESGRWYVDLPEWESVKADLEMVEGADLFLEILAQGESEVHVILSPDYFPNSDMLEFIKFGDLESWELGEGAWYHLNSYVGIEYNLTMWLCDVTKFVFKKFPDCIYFCKLN